jgi:hypothetical protein
MSRTGGIDEFRIEEKGGRLFLIPVMLDETEGPAVDFTDTPGVWRD